MVNKFWSSPVSRALFLLAYTGLIIFGSLYPFSGWQYSPADITSIFFPAERRIITRTDVLTNVLAYFPLGALALYYFQHKATVNKSIGLSLLFAAALSIVMEITQLYLTSRHASSIDWFTNVLGALLGALIAAFVTSQPQLLRGLAWLRRRWFLPGTLVNVGLGVVFIGLLAETRPFISSTEAVLHFQLLLQFALTGASLALLISLLVPSRLIMSAASLMIVTIFLLRAGATFLLYKFSWSRILPAEPIIGTLAGLFIALIALRENQREHKYLAGISVLLLLLFLQLKSWLEQGKVGTIFSWWQLKGSMFNFTGATHAISEVWPLIALAYLLAYYAFGNKKS